MNKYTISVIVSHKKECERIEERVEKIVYGVNAYAALMQFCVNLELLTLELRGVVVIHSTVKVCKIRERRLKNEHSATN